MTTTSHRQPHSAGVTSSDLAILDYLTGPSNPSHRSRQGRAGGGPAAASAATSTTTRDQTSHSHSPPVDPAQGKKLPRREQPLDPLLISAVIEGRAPLATRNHFGHEFQSQSHDNVMQSSVKRLALTFQSLVLMHDVSTSQAFLVDSQARTRPAMTRPDLPLHLLGLRSTAPPGRTRTPS